MAGLPALWRDNVGICIRFTYFLFYMISGATISQGLILICDRVVVALRGIEGAREVSHLPIFRSIKNRG